MIPSRCNLRTVVRVWHARAVAWMEERDDRRGNDELRRFRGEAAELLQVNETPRSPPEGKRD